MPIISIGRRYGLSVGLLIFGDRGVTLDRTYQLNTRGNTDFLNMLAFERLKSTKISKPESVQSQLDERLEPRNIHIGPSD